MHKAETDSRIDGELLRQIIDMLPVGVWISDASGRLVANNPAGRGIWAGERWLEIEHCEHCGEYKGWWAATGKRIEPHEWALARAIERGEVSVNEVIDIECFDGSRKTILNSAMPLYDAAGRLCAGVVTNQDITALKRTQDELARTRGELEALTAELIGLRERERRSLSRDLHDGIGQGLSALKMMIAGARRRPPADVDAALVNAAQVADELLNEVRELARSLRPPQLDDLGLAAALRWHIDRSVRACGLACRFSDNLGEARLPAEVEQGAFRVAQEAISNAVQHAQAYAVSVQLTRGERALELQVADDGLGFDPQRRQDDGRHHLGLIGMRERVQALGGVFSVDSAPGRGCTVRALFPLAEGA